MTRRISHLSILLALGLVLNMAVQAFSIQGMKVDFIVVMLCISILDAESFKEAVMIGISYGVLTGLTTSFPFGQVANLIDKIIVSMMLYSTISFLNLKIDNKVSLAIYAAFATVLSGALFLSIALAMAKNTELFLFLFMTVVLPSMIGNSIVIIIFSQVFDKINKIR